MRNKIRFVLNGQMEVIDDCLPTDTVLDFLRDEKNLVGSKEGCAEGDCGACTVVLAENVDGELRYNAVNACIIFLPTLDGKHLITVEALQQEDGSLHPVQQAMVEQHGSQCGFCTPGIVMSLFAMYQQQRSELPSRKSIDACLAGNLCRCTGYAPIVRAARQSLSPGGTDKFQKAEAETLEILAGLESDQTLSISNGGRTFLAPTTLEQLCSELASHPDATIVAGATDVGLWVTKQLLQPETVIYTGNVLELGIIEQDQHGYLSIGAAVTYTQAMPQLLAIYPDFEELITRLGALQVRNVGTIGGNIANGSPIGDMPPALIALDAKLVLASTNGERTIDLESFFLEYGVQDLRPGECVARILLPLPSEDQLFRTYKISKRIEQDISAVCAAFAIRMTDGKVSSARVCFGGMAAIPKRAAHCEQALNGKDWNQQTIEYAMAAIGKDFSPITDMRASAPYRLRVAINLLKRFYLETSNQLFPVRLAPYSDLQPGSAE